MHAEFFLDPHLRLDAASSAKAEQAERNRARNLLAMEGLGLSVPVRAEFCVNATCQFKRPHDPAVRILESLDPDPVRPLTEALFRAALGIQERDQLS